MDYSSKYGLAYTLSDGRIGAYFNDATRMVESRSGGGGGSSGGLSASLRSVDYFTRARGAKADQVVRMEVDEPRQCADERKKLILIKNFRNYLASSQEKEGTSRGRSCLPAWCPSSPESEGVHVKKWVRVRHAIVFHLSNKSWQVVFTDNSGYEVFMKSNMCSFLDTKGGAGNMKSFMLEQIADVADLQTHRRLEYARNAVFSLINPSSSAAGGGGLHEEVATQGG
jgi:polo-like kinase 1